MAAAAAIFVPGRQHRVDGVEQVDLLDALVLPSNLIQRRLRSCIETLQRGFVLRVELEIFVIVEHFACSLRSHRRKECVADALA